MKAIEAIYEDGKIKLLEDLGIQRGKLYIIVVEDDNKNDFDWSPDCIEEKKFLSSITARTISEWQNEEEDKIWE